MDDDLFKLPLTSENLQEFSKKLNKASPPEIAELIEKKEEEERLPIFNSLDESKSVQVFEYLPFRIQKEILGSLSYERVARLLNAMAPDDRTRFLEDLPADQILQLLKYLSPEERALSTKLLGYPENSVGRLMTPDYIAIHLDWTVRHVLDYIREKGKDSETINVIYAVDDQGILLDDFRIRQFILASLEAKASDLADGHFLALKVDDPIDKAIDVFRKNDRVALPVVDAKGLLLGIVTLDDIMNISVEKDTETMQKIAGVAALKEPYMDTPFFDLMRKRVGWLLILFIGEMFTATAMGYFQDEIAKAVVLALFLPLIISSGGNAGSQASTLIVRAMALGEITVKDWFRIMHREILSGLFLGCILGAVGFFRVTLWSLFSNIYGAHWLSVAFTVFLALIGVVLWGSLSGSMLPLVLRRLGLDPAVSSAPFVATLVDVTGIVIYFSIALIVLQGTLL